MAVIKTPDQRIRVFISSTIGELAEERKAAREGISNLRLIPVFFEAGARPHPPRDLYSAYLEQSHIFLGIYWNSYGWVAPGADISGLEDEYRLCGNNKPKLIYVKRSDDRQEKLNKLLEDIEKSETACYQFFSDADELQKLIENDLSVLMSEIFESALLEGQKVVNEYNHLEVARKFFDLPIIKSDLIGRDEDLEKVCDLILRKDVSLITLLGAGGTGKTTLSIHIGHCLKDRFKDGVVFVPLAPITDHKLTASVLADHLGLQDSGKQPMEETLIDFMYDKKILLILDNFEQIIESSTLVSNIISRCGDVKIVITSRTSLHIRNERIYNLLPLMLPEESIRLRGNELLNFPATALFIERAKEVNPSLELNEDNCKAILEICQRMDGLPLAIELAAARTRFFQPAALMSRIDKTLDLVNKGHKDLPERQQTLRAAIEWSYNLLGEETKKVFRQLGIFKRSWTLEAADVIINGTDQNKDIEELTESLLDVSLIKPILVSISAEPRFNMLQTVHEYALEKLLQSEEAEETKRRYALYFYELCRSSEWEIWDVNSQAWLDKLDYELQNIRASFYILIEIKEIEKAWDLFYYMVSFWTLKGGYSEGLEWARSAGIGVPEHEQHKNISDAIRGRTLAWAALAKFMLFQIEDAFSYLNTAQAFLEHTEDKIAYAFALTIDACYGAFIGIDYVNDKMLKTIPLVKEVNNPFITIQFSSWSFEYYRQKGEIDTIYKNLDESRILAMNMNNSYLLATILLSKYNLQLVEGNLNFQELIREATEIYNMMPAKGYNGMKSAMISMVAYAYFRLDSPEIWGPMFKALEYARIAGEKESELYGVMLTSAVFKKAGKNELALKMFGSLEELLEKTNYPLIGASEYQYNEAREIVMKDYVKSANDAFEQGRKLKLVEAIVLALSVKSEFTS
ncbi:MAG: DUF4062 domain-containing protein [Flavobacteriales bacterium]|nr:DUF4062 domain-containing protein [Flavobacteriales bacterium]